MALIPTTLLAPEGLEEAFHTFNQLSQQLADSYQSLQGQVTQLTSELASARDARIQELTEKERLACRLTTLLNALPGGVVVLDGKGCIQEFNPAAGELLEGLVQGEAWLSLIDRVFSPRSDDGHEVSLVDGRRVNISTCPLGTEPGQILLITDVTEMRALQDRLSQHQRLAAMGQMAAALAHQIRTPLSSALLNASNLKRIQVNETQRQQSAEKIISRLRHLECLINDMLLYARGTVTGEQYFEVHDLLVEMVTTVEAPLRATGTSLYLNDATCSIKMWGNREVLLSALINLVVNAQQAMARGGEIIIEASLTDAQELSLSVSDNGPGFSSESKQRAFEPFYTTRAEGTGLGLAVVATVVRAHDGNVELESELGKGSRFSLIFPHTRLELNKEHLFIMASPAEQAISTHPHTATSRGAA